MEWQSGQRAKLRSLPPIHEVAQTSVTGTMDWQVTEFWMYNTLDIVKWGNRWGWGQVRCQSPSSRFRQNKNTINSSTSLFIIFKLNKRFALARTNGKATRTESRSASVQSYQEMRSSVTQQWGFSSNKGWVRGEAYLQGVSKQRVFSPRCCE